MQSLLKREISSAIYSSVFYAYSAIVVFFCLFSVFLLSRFIEAGQSGLSNTFFKWHPWIHALTVPVLAIRAWSDEHRYGMLEVLATQPVSTLSVVVSKFVVGGWSIAVALIFTAPIVVVVAWLGEPDWGAMASGYLASWLCALAFFALALAVCAVMQGSIGAYLCAVGLGLCLVVMGMDSIATTMLSSFPKLMWLTQLLAAISVLPKFTLMVSGKLPLAGLLEFIVLLSLGLALAHRAVLHSRQSPKSGWRLIDAKNGVPPLLGIALALVCLLGLSRIAYWIDTTDDRRYSLPKSLVTILQNVERPVALKLFATPQHDQFSFQLAQYYPRVQNALALLASTSEQIEFHEYDPSRDSAAANSVQFDQIQSFSMGEGEPLVFGLVVESAGRKRIFDVLSPAFEQQFLADTFQAIVDVSHQQRYRVGYYNGFFETAKPQLSLRQWSIFEALSDQYQLVDVSDIDSTAWAELDALVLLQPHVADHHLQTQFSQFIDYGGHVLAFVDPYSFVYEKYGAGVQASIGLGETPAFIEQLGIKVRNKTVIEDSELATMVNGGDSMDYDAAILSLGPEQFSSSHALTAGFDNAEIPYASAVAIRKGVAADTLITTTPEANLMDFSDSEAATAVLMQGQMPLAVSLTTQGAAPANVILVGDADWLHVDIAGYTQGGLFASSVNANAALAKSMLSYLLGDVSLNQLRVRDSARRPLQGWFAQRELIHQHYQPQLDALERQLTQLAEQAQQLQVRRESAPATLRGSLLKQIDDITQQHRAVALKRSALNSERDAAVTHRMNAIKWWSVFSAPSLLMLLGFMVLLLRYKNVGRVA